MNLLVDIVLALIIALSPTISIDSYTMAVNTNVSVPVKILNASAFAGGSAKIAYNSSIVSVKAVTPGDFGIPTRNIDNANGSVHLAVCRVTAVGLDEAVLANVLFDGMSGGFTTLKIQNALLNFEDGNTTIPETADGSITVLNNNNDSTTPSPTPPSNTGTEAGATTGSPGGRGYADSTATGEIEAITSASSSASDVNSTISITIGSFTTCPHSNVSVHVELSNANEIAGGSVKITFNPSVVNAKRVLPGDFGTPVANINNSAGFVYIACASPIAVGKANARLASIIFEGLSEGLTPLDIQDAALNDKDGNLITPGTTSDGMIEVVYPPTSTSPIVKENATTTIAVREHGVLLAIILVLAAGVMVIAHLRKRRYKGER